ncbi:Stk1 family PASTA domain-containing Ser/Thr kinase [Kitasatospora sp. HUAS MG31]|uniref:non-specific serine/threonine protein kinase n=2 Tax=Kitasatospora camelliae TaxID=3156397 RepID=A0AAU8K9Y7_9ACTN
MASVYRARDTVLGRTVAVKTLHADLARDPSFRARFRREAQAVAALNHPNIVAVHDSGEDDGADGTVQFIVMEYVEGRSLRELVRDRTAPAPASALPLDLALSVTASVLDALECSHRRGLVHRDIKPANVMFTADGTVKVMDFGIARALQSDATAMTRTGTVLGTPQYLSPEQALGRPADARSDLYSVGCMLFELLTGSLPFDGESTMSVLYQHVQQPPPAPSSLDPSLPPAVDAVVARALRKDPAERYPSAGSMAEELRRIAAGEPLAEPTPTVVTPVHDAPTVTAGTVPADGGADPGHAEAPDATTGTTAGGGTSTVGRESFTVDGDPAERITMRTGTPGDDGRGDGRTFTTTVRLGTHPRSADARRTVRNLRIFTGLAFSVIVLLIAGAGFGAPYLFGGVGHASHTPDPRATGPYLWCDPDVSNGHLNPPSFTGMSADEARTCAEIAGLRIDQKTTTGTKYDKDTVTRQEPSTTQSVGRGGTVTVWVSTGGDPRAKGDLATCELEEQHGRIPVPWLKGRTVAETRLCADIARVTLREAGTVQDALVPAGQVAKQEPAEGNVARGDTVTVWISSGGDPRAVGALSGCDFYTTSDRPQAPRLEFMTVENARSCAEIAGLKLEEHAVADGIRSGGQIVRQEPSGGAHVDPGATLKIWVSSGP